MNPSNTVRMEVKPGPLSSLEEVVERLFTVLPDTWTLNRRILYEFEQIEESKEPFIITLTGKHGGKGAPGQEPILVSLCIVPASAAESSQLRYPEMSFWGRSPWGPVYAGSIHAESLWPDYTEDIIGALDIRPAD